MCHVFVYQTATLLETYRKLIGPLSVSDKLL